MTTCFRIHIYKHHKHGNLHVSKQKAYQCTSISLQRHAVKVSNLLDGFKRLLVQHSFRKRNVSHQFHLHTRFFNSSPRITLLTWLAQFTKSRMLAHRSTCLETKFVFRSHAQLIKMLTKKNGKFTLYIVKFFTLPFLHPYKYMKWSIAHRRYIVLALVFKYLIVGSNSRFRSRSSKKSPAKKNQPPNLLTWGIQQ